MEQGQTEKKEAVYSPDEAAAILKVSRDTIMRRIHDGTIWAVKIGRLYRISQAEIDRLTGIGIVK